MQRVPFCVLATVLCVVCSFVPVAAEEAPAAALDGLKAQLLSLKADYDGKIQALQEQIEQLQMQMLQAPGAGEEAAAPAPPPQTIPGALNPAIGVAGNFLSRADNQRVYSDEGTRIDNKINLREAELDMRVPVDPYADGVLIVAIESETPGQYSAGVEEGYVTLKKLPFMESPPAGLRFKIGRFRPSFGKFNILHTHDLPQSYRSLVTEEFLGPDGFVQNGVSASFFLPTPRDAAWNLDATAEVLTGGDAAFSPNPMGRLTYLGHLRWYRPFTASTDIEAGWSSLYRPASRNLPEADIHALDFLARWKPLRRGESHSFLLGGELMFARRAYPEGSEPPDVARAIVAQELPPGHGKPLGESLFAQWQFNRRLYAGARVDHTDTLYDPELTRSSVTPYVSYYFSEFLRFRINYEHRWSDFATEDGRNAVYFELNWIFGAHPPEPFWVNK